MGDNPNMRIYDAVRAVPPEAIKPITAGRLKGKSDINPMWRIKVLTEQFGPCGEGWYTEGVRYWTVIQEKSMEMAVFCELQLHTKGENGWSAPIYGIGGNTVIAAEKNGLYLDDEAYKKAYTDALSVACKALGIGADVYWQADRTKYSDVTEPDERQPAAIQPTKQPTKQPATVQPMQQPDAVQFDYRAALTQYKQARNLTSEQFADLRNACIICGAVQDIRSGDMTQRDWETLFRAIDEQIAKAS